MRFDGTRLLSAALCALAVLAIPLPALTQTPTFKLPDSDQRLCWDSAGTPISCAGTGQDGDYANNSPTANGLNYTISNDTVLDNNTGLTWQRGGDGQTYTWEAAKAACTSLNLGGFATGWRLPSKKELAGIVDYAIPAPGPVFPSAFTNSFAYYYWTSTPLADGSGLYAWGAYIPWGNIAAAAKSTTPMHVRCVRGDEYGNVTGTAPVRPELVVNQNRTVTDMRTGLTWQQDESGTKTWDQALGYCNTLTLAGLEWRLPNIKELESLIDDTRYGPAVDPAAFPNAVQWLYWSSTSYPAVPSALWRIDFTTGYIDGYSKGSPAINVKCVSNADPTAPSLTAVSPASGASKGGTLVTITGTNLTGATSVTFGGTAATAVTVVGPTSVTCRTPARSAGTVDVAVITPDGTATKASAYTYTTPAIALSNSLVPENAAVGTVIGTLSTTGGDVGDSFTYALATGTGDTDNASFEIVGNELRVLLALDFRVKNPYSIRVRSTDSAASAIEAAFTISTPTYVLWTRSDTGRAVLWEIDQSLPTGKDQVKRSVSLYSSSGVGAPWQATGYTHVSATEGYVLWTRSDTGRAVLWEIDPSLPAGSAQLKRLVSLYSTSGVGAPWQATSYTHVSATEGYVLWTRSDTGRADLWQIDPSLPTGKEQVKRSVSLYSSSGVGAPWQATSYTHVSPTEGYVLWTRSDTGRADLWQIDPSLPVGMEQVKRSGALYSKSGVGAPWQASGYYRFGPVTASSPDARDLNEVLGELLPADIEP